MTMIVQLIDMQEQEERYDCTLRSVHDASIILTKRIGKSEPLPLVGQVLLMNSNGQGMMFPFSILIDEKGDLFPDPGPREKLPVKELRAKAIRSANVTGKTVIDVGGYDGTAASFALAHGARRAIVVDNGEYLSYDGWEARLMPPFVEHHGCDFLQWEEPADILICGNVIYHVREPWTFLRRARWLCRDAMVLWTPVVENDAPAWQVHDPDESVGGPYRQGVDVPYQHVFWRPSLAGLLMLLRRTGWTAIEIVGQVGENVAVVAR